MDSFVFNNFKYRLINGDVPNKDTWQFWPVNTKFVDDFEENLRYFKTSADFSAFCPQYVFEEWQKNKTTWEKQWENYQATVFPTKYNYVAMQETDTPSEPEYIDEKSVDFLIERYPNQKHLKKLFFEEDNLFFREVSEEVDIDGKRKRGIGRGFYFVRTSEELKWCANKVNSNIYDNRINIVLGDNIGSDISSNENDSVTLYNLIDNNRMKTIDYSIGSNPAQPYEGIFFGNGYKFENIKLVCSKETNGIFGYLGTSGWIDSVDVDGYIIIQSNKEIDLDHLVREGTDVVAGFLCGKNNGKIRNIRMDGKIIFNNFLPKMYSTKSKGQAIDSDNLVAYDSYMYYPDYYCYNNPGNIIPYLGYFNEGVFATYSGYNKTNDLGLINQYWSTELLVTDTFDERKIIEPNRESPKEWYYWDGLAAPNGGYFMHYTAPVNRKNILFYDGNIVAQTNMGFNDNNAEYKSPRISTLGLILWDTSNNTGNGGSSIEWAHYFDTSIKLSQQNRVAYYVSPLIGVNNNEVHNVNVSAQIYLSGTFVGFMGGIIGKQCQGRIDSVYSNIVVDDLLTTGVLKDTGKYTYYLRNYIDNNDYWFPQKSIKNIGGVIGSLVVGNFQSTQLDSVSSNFVNKNAVVFNKQNGDIEYDDYYFMNRYGGIAAMVEYNSTNISNLWDINGDGTAINDINNPLVRSILITNSIFQYNESTDLVSEVTKLTTSQCSVLPAGASNMLGVSSPLFPEIKPTYLTIPSLLQTPFPNKGSSPVNIANPATAVVSMGFVPGVGTYGYTYNYYTVYKEFNRVGLFTIDQQLAAPITDPNFWSINTECDLPGVTNAPVYWAEQYRMPAYGDMKGNGIAGGVVDRLNITAGENFDLDITKIAGKLVIWNNNIVINDTPDRIIDNPFTATTVPAAAGITLAECNVYDANKNLIFTATCPDYVAHLNAGDQAYQNTTAIAKTGHYDGNKYLTTYPYFGSDLYIIPNTITVEQSEEENISDLIDPDSYNYIVLTAAEPSYDAGYRMTTWGGNLLYDSKHVSLGVSAVSATIKGEAFKYYPFTTVPIPENKKISDLYTIQVGVGRGKRQGIHNTVTVDSGESEETILIKFNDKFKTDNIGGAESGFVFYVDYTDEPNDDSYLWYVLPFDPKPFNYRTDSYNLHPPYGKFHSIYVAAYDAAKKEKNAHEIDDMQAGGALDFKIEHIEYNTYYFRGFKEDYVPNKTNEIDWGEPNIVPDVTVKTLTGYKWGVYDGVKKFEMIDHPDQGTTNTAEAATGYVSSREYITDEDWIVADDTYKYPCYAELTDDYGDAVANMSAVPLNHLPEEEWNWQNELVDYEYVGTSDAEEEEGGVRYRYDYFGAASLFKNKYQSVVQSLIYTPYNTYSTPKSWYTFNKKGRFINNLLNSAPMPYNGIELKNPDAVNWVEIFNKKFTKSAVNPDFGDILDKNIADSEEPTYETDFYKFSYKKEQMYNNLGKTGISVFVEYNTNNDKAGFWFYNKDNTGIANPTDGNILYYPNVFNIGKTLNQETIRGYLLEKDSLELSGFSADDFQGLYVTDSKLNPVMYIDVGLGECAEGTTWSLSSQPSTTINYNELSNIAKNNGMINSNYGTGVSGLMLEID